MSASGQIWKHWLPAVAVALVVAAAVVVLKRTAPENNPERKPVPPARVAVYSVQGHDLQPVERLTGRLQPARRAQLRFEVSGRVSERMVEPGVRVEAGEILMRLAAGDYRDALSEAEAQLNLEREGVRRDRRLLKLAAENRALQEKEVDRLEQLDQKSMVARSGLDQARQTLAQLASEEARLRYSVESAESRLQLRRTAVERARRNLERTRLRAPFAGVVNRVQMQMGDYVSPTQNVVELIDVASLEFYAEARGDVAAAQHLGKQVQVRVAGRELEGTIVALEQDPDPSTFTYALRVRVPASAGISGMTAAADLTLPFLDDVMAVPASAVAYEQGAAYVLAVNDSRLHRRPVQLGQRVGQWQVIRKGLHAGERIVRRDVAALQEGQEVSVETTGAASLPATEG